MEQEQSDLKYEAYMLAAVMMEEKYGSFKDPLWEKDKYRLRIKLLSGKNRSKQGFTHSLEY